MLDLNFVRDNLPLVEEKLRQRGMDPAQVLKDFHQVDTQRRHAITEAETMKARRNRASEEIAKLKKSGQDATAQISETKELREQIQQREKAAEEFEASLQNILAGIPNLPHESVPVGKTPKITSKYGAGARHPNSISLPSRTGNWAKNSAFSISNAPPNSPARASRCTGTWEQGWSGRWPISCSICTPASTATPRCCRLTW